MLTFAPRFPSGRGLFSCFISLWLAAVAAAAAKPDAIDKAVAEFFRPFQHDLAVLAPDGRRVALSEVLPGRPPAIVVVDIDERSSRSHAVADDPSNGVLQLQWISDTLLVFTTRSRGVGTLDTVSGEIIALMTARDFDLYQPEPTLGPRRQESLVTADMAGDASRSTSLDFEGRRDVTLREALAREQVSGDLFSAEAKRDSGRALRPFLLGAKPASPHTVVIEVRSDEDLHAYRRWDRRQVTVGANVYLYERGSGPPPLREDLRGTGDAGYATYDVEYLPPPLVVVELDVVTGRRKEIANEPNWRRTGIDPQGRLRLALEQNGRRFRYLYRAEEGRSWVPLDSLVKTETPLAFNVTAETLLAARSVPVGFDATGKILFIVTNVGRDTFVLRGFDPATGRLNALDVGHPRYDLIEPTALSVADQLCYDPRTRGPAGVRFGAARRDTAWFSPAITALQEQLGKQRGTPRADVRQWNAAGTRFLAEVSGHDDPGGFVVVDPAKGVSLRVGDRAPWLAGAKHNVTADFDFVSDDGRRLAGRFTYPRKPRLQPPPVLVYFHDGPWFAESPQFNRGAQALAALGFAVLQMNHRGSGGLGRAHLHGIEGGLDRAALRDVQAMLGRAAAGKVPINTKLVAALGNGVGGYLAVRMAQLAPEMFRCAVAINAPGDLEAWRKHPQVVPTLLSDLRSQFFGTDPALAREQSAVAAGPSTRAPVLVVHGTENAYVPVSLGRDLYRALKKGAAETQWLELPAEGHGGWSNETTAKLFAELGRFFNATIYTFDVKVQAPEVVR